MAAPKGMYIYPVKTVSEARTVIAPEFQPNLFENHLYVNLDEIRDTTYLDELCFNLGYTEQNNSFEESSDYIKIIFSGHRGCGKSAELRRINKKLQHPERYFTVFIDLEQEVEVGSFQYADFFALLIHKLIERLAEEGISSGEKSLQDLAKRFFEKKETTHTNKGKSTTNADVQGSIGFKLFGLGSQASFKQAFSGESEIATTVRQEIKRNTLGLINEFNAALVDVRDAVSKHTKGRDILFIIDGSEKVQAEVYTDLFVKNGNMVSEISLNMIIAVPISAHFEIEQAPTKFTDRYTVPMIRLDIHPDGADKMKEIIGCRIDLNTFIEPEALDKCVYFSGGCIRQLFQVVHTSLKKSLGSKIGLQHVEKAVKELGQDLWEYLQTDHLAILKAGNYRPADPVTGKLLYLLILLKYNGHIEINPLLKHYSDFEAWMHRQP